MLPACRALLGVVSRHELWRLFFDDVQAGAEELTTSCTFEADGSEIERVERFA